jgi:hypothetical protein
VFGQLADGSEGNFANPQRLKQVSQIKREGNSNFYGLSESKETRKL